MDKKQELPQHEEAPDPDMGKNGKSRRPKESTQQKTDKPHINLANASKTNEEKARSEQNKSSDGTFVEDPEPDSGSVQQKKTRAMRRAAARQKNKENLKKYTGLFHGRDTAKGHRGNLSKELPLDNPEGQRKVSRPALEPLPEGLLHKYPGSLTNPVSQRIDSVAQPESPILSRPVSDGSQKTREHSEAFSESCRSRTPASDRLRTLQNYSNATPVSKRSGPFISERLGIDGEDPRASPVSDPAIHAAPECPIFQKESSREIQVSNRTESLIPESSRVQEIGSGGCINRDNAIDTYAQNSNILRGGPEASIEPALRRSSRIEGRRQGVSRQDSTYALPKISNIRRKGVEAPIKPFSRITPPTRVQRQTVLGQNSSFAIAKDKDLSHTAVESTHLLQERLEYLRLNHSEDMVIKHVASMISLSHEDGWRCFDRGPEFAISEERWNEMPAKTLEIVAEYYREIMDFIVYDWGLSDDLDQEDMQQKQVLGKSQSALTSASRELLESTFDERSWENKLRACAIICRNHLRSNSEESFFCWDKSLNPSIFWDRIPSLSKSAISHYWRLKGLLTPQSLNILCIKTKHEAEDHAAGIIWPSFSEIGLHYTWEDDDDTERPLTAFEKEIPFSQEDNDLINESSNTQQRDASAVGVGMPEIEVSSSRNQEESLRTSHEGSGTLNPSSLSQATEPGSLRGQSIRNISISSFYAQVTRFLEAVNGVDDDVDSS